MIPKRQTTVENMGLIIGYRQVTHILVFIRYNVNYSRLKLNYLF